MTTTVKPDSDAIHLPVAAGVMRQNTPVFTLALARYQSLGLTQSEAMALLKG